MVTSPDNPMLAATRRPSTAVISRETPPTVPSWVADSVEREPQASSNGAAPLQTIQHGNGLCLTTLRWPGADALDPRSFRAAALAIYQRLHAALRSLPAPYPVRLWNFIPSIHAPAGPPADLDRYRVFNLGRFDAFESWIGEARFARALPTATGVGHTGEDLVVHALSAVSPGTPVDNPRQRPAYEYSTRHGPRPPCFARATIAQIGARQLVLVGGTASVVGEESAHADGAGALQRQLDETLKNLRAVLRSAGLSGPDPLTHIRHARVYCPRADDLPDVCRTVAERLSSAARIEPVRADICRRELLVEIEAIAETAPIITNGKPGGSQT